MSRSLYARLHRRFGPRQPVRARAAKIAATRAAAAPNLPRPGFFRPPAAAPAAGRPRAVVVGGGFGGMMAAATLCEAFEVTVVEARERLGGRVWTQAGPENRLIEAGAELIGYNHMLWLTLAEDCELGLSLLTDDEASAYMDLDLPMMLDGQVLSRAQLQTIYDEMGDAFDRMAADAAAVTDPFTPWTAPNAQTLDDTPLSSWIAGQPVGQLTKAALEAQFANNNGAPSAQQSYLANLALVAGGAMNGEPDAFFTETETVRCEAGNQSLAYALQGRILSYGGQVLQNTPVERIASGPGGVTVTLQPGGELQADVLVLATPPTVWPEVGPSPIPSSFRMSMGLVCKYLSDVDARFWLPSRQSPSSVSEAYGMTWEGTDNQIGRQPEFSLFAGGPAAEHALDLWRSDPDQLHAFYDQSIGQIYPGYVGARRQWPQFMAWPYEPWTQTGYSCPTPGQVCAVAPNLAGTWEENIYFAGEHACPAFFGYMEGALMSGWTAGLAILNRFCAAQP